MNKVHDAYNLFDEITQRALNQLRTWLRGLVLNHCLQCRVRELGTL